MSELLTVLKSQEGFISANGVDAERVAEAEEKLGLKFALDYKEYLLEFGIACIDGHEFTGLIDPPGDESVIEITERARTKNHFGGDMYVLENLGIDFAYIWQKTNGEVYQTVGNSKPELVCGSFAEYVEMCDDEDE